jgi:hypothetical protein
MDPSTDEGVSEMVGLLILAMLLLIAAAAPRYGVDSRAEDHEGRRSPLDDVRALRRALSRHGVHVAR